MLIITRRIGESIRINDDIEIKVLGMVGNQTRLGIQAPQEFIIHRQEIYDKINSNPVKPGFSLRSDERSER